MSDNRENSGGPRSEITLLDLALLVVHRRWWALAGFAVATIAGLYLILTQPQPGYEGTAALEMVSVPAWLGDTEAREQARTAIRRTVAGLDETGDVAFEVTLGGNDLRLQVVDPERERVEAILARAIGRATLELERAWLPLARAARDEWTGKKDELVMLHAELRESREAETRTLERAALITAEMAVRDRIDAEDQRGREGHLARLLSADASGHLDEVRVTDEPRIDYRSRTPVILFLTVAIGLLLGLFAAFTAEFVANLRAALRSSRH